MNTVIKFLLSLFFCLILLSLFTMIAVFMGKETPLVLNVLWLQNKLYLPIIITILFSLRGYAKNFGWRSTLSQIWNRSPGWMVFLIVMINSLVLCGFIACYLVQQKLGLAPSNNEIIPLVSAFLSSFAFVLIFSTIKKPDLPSTYAERNRERGSIPLKWNTI